LEGLPVDGVIEGGGAAELIVEEPSSERMSGGEGNEGGGAAELMREEPSSERMS
jgi:hypothetical protein